MGDRERIEFEVIGLPAPQGSKRHVGGGRMVESSKNVAPWRDSVAWAGREAMAGRPAFDEPVTVEVSFHLPPTGRWTKAESAVGERWKPRKPDLDKLLRSTLDALTTAAVIVDDARVVQVQMGKVEALGPSGAVIVVRPAPTLGGAS